MQKEETITKTFKKAVLDRYFRYRGVKVERALNHYKVLEQKALTMDEVDDIIDASLTNFKKSLEK